MVEVYSQASDGKEALCGRQPTILFSRRYIFSFIVSCLLLLSKNQKNTKIFSLKQSEEENFQVQYWAKKRDTFLPPLKHPKIFSKLQMTSILFSKNVSRWPKRDTFSGNQIFSKSGACHDLPKRDTFLGGFKKNFDRYKTKNVTLPVRPRFPYLECILLLPFWRVAL